MNTPEVHRAEIALSGEGELIRIETTHIMVANDDGSDFMMGKQSELVRHSSVRRTIDEQLKRVRERIVQSMADNIE